MGLNLAEFVRDIRAPKVDPALAAQRFRLCELCQEVDGSGAQMPRLLPVPAVVRGLTGLSCALFCGDPRWQSPWRTEARDGCGCMMNLKCQSSTAHCPRGRW